MGFHPIDDILSTPEGKNIAIYLGVGIGGSLEDILDGLNDFQKSLEEIQDMDLADPQATLELTVDLQKKLGKPYLHLFNLMDMLDEWAASYETAYPDRYKK